MRAPDSDFETQRHLQTNKSGELNCGQITLRLLLNWLLSTIKRMEQNSYLEICSVWRSHQYIIRVWIMNEIMRLVVESSRTFFLQNSPRRGQVPSLTKTLSL